MLAAASPLASHGHTPRDMSHNEDSDEEVYLSDPSDDDESKSVDGYEYANDNEGAADFGAASGVGPAEALDFALHDAEAERAAKQEDVPRSEAAAETKKPGLSAAATPFVPPGQDPVASSGKNDTVESPKQASDATLSASKPAQEAAKEPPRPSEERDSPEAPETPRASKGESKDADPGSPIDVRGMLQRAAASQGEEPASSTDSGVGTSGQRQPHTAKNPATDVEPASVSGSQAAEAQEKPAASSQRSVQGDTAVDPEKQKSAEEKPVPEKDAPAKEDPSAGAAENEAKAGGSSAAEAPKAAEGKPPSAMPSLPERKRPGSAMPSLPSRPARRSAPAPAPVEESDPKPSEPASNGGKESKEDSTAASKEPVKAQEAAQEPGSADSGTRQPPANGQDRPQGRAAEQPPANGQRGPITLQRVNPPPEQNRGPEDAKVKKLREELRELRILLLRVGSRLNLSNHAMIEHVKYRLGLAERIRLGRGDTSEDVAQVAKQREEASPEEELADVTVLVIGPAGAGKTATINSLLGREALPVDPFEGSRKIAQASGTVFGMKLRFIDTPGLHTAAESFSYNSRVLRQIDGARKKYQPKLVMYCDRLDSLRRDLSDIPVLRQITETLGSEVWYNTVLILTHARSPGPLGPNNEPLNFDTLSQNRAAMLSRAIQAAVGDSRITAPAGFAENSPSCPKNQDGEATLPNGQAWRRFVLMWVLSMRILSDADSLLEVAPRENAAAGSQQQILQQLFQAQRGQKMPPLQYLVPNMIRHAGPRAYPDAEREVKSEDEIKAIKDFEIRRQEYRKRTEYLKGKHLERLALALPANQDEVEGDAREGPSPGPPLAPTFDVDDHTHLYRSFEPKQGDSAWLTRARLDQNCFDHTDGVDSLTTERTVVFRRKGQDLGGVPAQAHAIIQKDKNTTLVQADTEASIYQRYNLIHTGRAQFLTLSGGDILYVSQLESQLAVPHFQRLTLGAMAARLGEDGAPPTKGHVALGLKLEEDLDLPGIPAINGRHGVKAGLARARVKLGNRREAATGWNAEYQLTGGKREASQVVASVSQMEYRGNKGRQYALSGAFPVSEETVLAPKVQLRDGQGNLYLRVTSHDHHQLGLAVLLPLGKALWDKLRRKDGA